MHKGMKISEEGYFWAVKPPSHTSFGPRFTTNTPVGQTVPRLTVWTAGAIGGDALRTVYGRGTAFAAGP